MSYTEGRREGRRQIDSPLSLMNFKTENEKGKPFGIGDASSSSSSSSPIPCLLINNTNAYSSIVGGIFGNFGMQNRLGLAKMKIKKRGTVGNFPCLS